MFFFIIIIIGPMDKQRLPSANLRQAIFNTQIHNGFFIKRTADTNATIAYLIVMTRYLQQAFQNAVIVEAGLFHYLLKA